MLYVYIYIYREREIYTHIERYIYPYIYVYVYVYVFDRAIVRGPQLPGRPNLRRGSWHDQLLYHIT